MTGPTVRYAAACAALALAGGMVCWPLLDGSGRTGLLVAVALALPVQVLAFAALHWGWDGQRRFLATWVGGMLARLALLGGALGIVAATPLSPAPTLLVLASLLFAMLLMEPFFLPQRPAKAGQP